MQANPEHYCRTLGGPVIRPTDDSLDARHAYAIYRAGLIEDLGDNLWICGRDGLKGEGQGQGKGGVVVHRVGHTFPQLIHKVLYKTWVSLNT